MRDMSQLFGVPKSLLDAVSFVQTEETEYQAKVKALMAKKGIKSLGELSSEEKKKFFSQLDAAHQAKNEEVKKTDDEDDEDEDDEKMKKNGKKKEKEELEEASGNGTSINTATAQKKRAEISQKIADTKAKHARELGALQKQKSSVKEEFLDEMDKSAPQPGRDGKVSHSTYGSRDKGDDFKGKQLLTKQITVKRMKKDALDILKKQGVAEAKSGTGELAEGFSAAMIAKLKDEYGKIGTIDPTSDSYKKLTAMLDKMEKKDLESLAGANIKFVSGLARNRVNRMNMKKEEVELTEYKQFMQKDMNDLATIKFNDPKLALSKFEPVKSSAGKRSFKGFQATHEITVGGNYGPAYDLAVVKKGDKYHGAFGAKIAGNEFSSPEDAANWTLKMYNWMRKAADPAAYLKDKVTFVKEEAEQTDEAIVKGKGYDNPDNVRKAPEGKLDLTSLMPGYNEKAARFFGVQAKGKLVKGSAQSAPQKMPKAQKEEKVPEYKTGGEPLAKKFEKSFEKMGVKAKIKMRTVNNISVNETVVEKVMNLKKKMKDEARDKKQTMKSGQPLSGKKEPIEINPEIAEK